MWPFKRKVKQRRLEVRKKAQAARPFRWKRFCEAGGVASVLLAAICYVGAGAMDVWPPHPLPYRIGQYVPDDIYARVGFEVPSPERHEEMIKNARQMPQQLEELTAAYLQGDLDLIDDLVGPGYVRHVVDISEDVVGPVGFGEAVMAFRTQFPDFHVRFDEVIVAGDRIVLRWMVTGTDTGGVGELPPTGMPIQISGASVIHVIDGRFVEEWMYYNEGAMMQQLGFTLAPPAMEILEEAEG